MLTTLRRFLPLVVLALSALTVSSHAAAQTIPHRARGGAQFVGPTDFVGTGQATHLGRYTEAGSVAFAPTSNPDVLAVSGNIVYTAANGDELHATVQGVLNTSSGAIAATLTYVGGSGRFAAASGASELAGQMLGGGAVSVTVAGRLGY